MSEPQVYTHGERLRNKAESDPALKHVLEKYQKWRDGSIAISGRTSEDIAELTRLLNVYKDYAEPFFDKRGNSAQEGLQPSILEEFFGYLFAPLAQSIGAELLRRPASTFIGLVFNPKDIKSLLTSPEYTVRSKDHDFVLGATLTISMKTDAGKGVSRSDILVVPAVAIECKRYLERNMLDECAGTAERIKRATPYCRYLVAAEFLKLDDAAPELSMIDEIFILRRQKNSDRQSEPLKPIYADLVEAIYADALAHLKRVWWDPSSGLQQGRVFNFPR